MNIMENIDQSELISVITPVYNDNGTLVKTVESVIEQTYTNWEMIIVDDGSINAVDGVLRHIADSRIKIFRHERSNANVARNFGISKSNGKYIAMLDSDDLWLKNHLQDCLTLLNEKDTDGLYGSVFLLYDKKKDYNKNDIVYARELKAGESIIDYLLTMVCGAQTSTIFVKSQSMKDILWDPILIEHQDYDFIVRFHNVYKSTVKKDPTVIYSLSSNRSFHFETCIKFLENNESDISPTVFCRYSLKMFSLAKRSEASIEYIEYFRRSMVKYRDYVSFQFYMSIQNPNNYWDLLRYKFCFLFYILKANFNRQHNKHS